MIPCSHGAWQMARFVASRCNPNAVPHSHPITTFSPKRCMHGFMPQVRALGIDSQAPNFQGKKRTTSGINQGAKMAVKIPFKPMPSPANAPISGLT